MQLLAHCSRMADGHLGGIMSFVPETGLTFVWKKKIKELCGK